MIDTFLIEMREEDGSLLGSFRALPMSVDLVAVGKEDGPYVHVVLEPTEGKYITSGAATFADVFTENPFQHIAKCVFDTVHICGAGKVESSPLVVFDTDLDSYVAPVCTCGVKFTGGICSDWCDLNQ